MPCHYEDPFFLLAFFIFWHPPLPSFLQAMSMFSSALASGQLGPLMNQFGLPAEAVDAANKGGQCSGSFALLENQKCLYFNRSPSRIPSWVNKKKLTPSHHCRRGSICQSHGNWDQVRPGRRLQRQERRGRRHEFGLRTLRYQLTHLPPIFYL